MSLRRTRSRDVVCQLCPHACRIPPGHAGDCRIRVNVEGTLRSVTYGRPCTVHVDPIEKKPLLHVLPGTRILSYATVGCNLHCRNCQNHAISQANPWDDGVRVMSARTGAYGITPDELVALAKQDQCPSIAATYTEPLIFFEYTRDTGEKARAAGLRYVTVTAGYLNAGPLRELCRVVDASNVDLKTMRPAAFRRNCGGVLRHVLRGLVVAREAGVWLEITSLVIPTFNDSAAEMRELCRWVVQELGPQTPVHFSRFHPDYQLRNLPPTPPETLLRAREIALEAGLRFPYIGNVPGGGGEDTRCPGCGATIIERVGFYVKRLDVVAGRCGRCQRPLEGIWS